MTVQDKKAEVITNVMSKLFNLPQMIELSSTDVEPCVEDALREMGIVIDNILYNAQLQFYLEIRTQWYVLGRIRTGQILNFKFSSGTGVDGKSADKSMIADVIGRLMADLDSQFRRWFEDFNKVNVQTTSGGQFKKKSKESKRLK